MAKVLMLIDEGFEDSEFMYPFYRFQEAGYQVQVAGEQAGTTYHGKNGLTAKSDLSADDASVDDYVALIIPGGRAPDHMRMNSAMVRIARDFMKSGKLVAAVCHGPQLLIETGTLMGRRLTGYPSIATDIRNAGATYLDEPAVVDVNLVTSRRPADLPAFCKTALDVLTKATART